MFSPLQGIKEKENEDVSEVTGRVSSVFITETPVKEPAVQEVQEMIESVKGSEPQRKSKKMK